MEHFKNLNEIPHSPKIYLSKLDDDVAGRNLKQLVNGQVENFEQSFHLAKFGDISPKHEELKQQVVENKKDVISENSLVTS